MKDVTLAPSPRRVATYQTRVDKIVDLSPRVKEFHLTFAKPTRLTFQAGQYVIATIPALPKPLKKDYSIASSPSQTDAIDLCITHVPGGKGSTYFHLLKGGETVQVMGPIGKFVMPPVPPRDVVFIATGSGIAPFRSMIQDCVERKVSKNMYLIFGNRYEEDILYKGEWVALQKSHPNFKIQHTLSRPSQAWTGEKGYVQEKILRFIPDHSSKDYYLCGLNKMILDTQQELVELGVPRAQIHYERYD